MTQKKTKHKTRRLRQNAFSVLYTYFAVATAPIALTLLNESIIVPYRWCLPFMIATIADVGAGYLLFRYGGLNFWEYEDDEDEE